MAQLSLRERLQPALFDRLIDDERVITCYEFSFACDELLRLGLKEKELVAILTAQGLRELDRDDPFLAHRAQEELPSARKKGSPSAQKGESSSARKGIALSAASAILTEGALNTADRTRGDIAPIGAGSVLTDGTSTSSSRAPGSGTLIAAEGVAGGTAQIRAIQSTSESAASFFRITLSAPAGRISLSSLKSLQLRPPGAPKGLALQAFCEITARNVVNASVETGDLKSLSMRRLRDYVCRDLAALLNCASLDAVVDLTSHPHVQTSVLNFGMPSLAGRSARSADPGQIAATIQAAVQRFEPRLSNVRVTPEMGEEGNETHILAFRIDAQLWGQPVPQQLVLRTSIDIDSGNVSLKESGLG